MQISETSSRGIIFTDDGKVILMYRKRDGMEYYCVPGGHVEPDDASEEEALRREIREELGIEVSIDQWLFDHFVDSWHNPGTFKKDRYFLCHYKSGQIGTGTAEEFSNPKGGVYRVEAHALSDIPELNLLPQKVKEYLLTSSQPSFPRKRESSLIAKFRKKLDSRFRGNDEEISGNSGRDEVSTSQNNNFSPTEIEAFSAIAEEWWKPHGKFAPIHKLNPARLSWIKEMIGQHKKIDMTKLQPLKGLRILDIGCGGGLVSEPLAALGADVTGIDISAPTINVAKQHAAKSGLNIDYRQALPEDLRDLGEKFDIVLALEIIEHVPDAGSLIKVCEELLNRDGLLILSTVNRTAKSWLFAIVLAEYVLHWLPAGTHDWHKFPKPSEVFEMLRENKLEPASLTGLEYRMLTNSFKISPRKLDINYMICAKRI